MRVRARGKACFAPGAASHSDFFKPFLADRAPQAGQGKPGQRNIGLFRRQDYNDQWLWIIERAEEDAGIVHDPLQAAGFVREKCLFAPVGGQDLVIVLAQQDTEQPRSLRHASAIEIGKKLCYLASGGPVIASGAACLEVDKAPL